MLFLTFLFKLNRVCTNPSLQRYVFNRSKSACTGSTIRAKSKIIFKLLLMLKLEGKKNYMNASSKKKERKKFVVSPSRMSIKLQLQNWRRITRCGEEIFKSSSPHLTLIISWTHQFTGLWSSGPLPWAGK